MIQVGLGKSRGDADADGAPESGDKAISFRR